MVNNFNESLIIQGRGEVHQHTGIETIINNITLINFQRI